MRVKLILCRAETWPRRLPAFLRSVEGAYGLGGSPLFGWCALINEWREQIDRDRKEGRRIVLAGNLAHGLQEAQLQRNRLLAHHGGRLHHFFRGLKFALGVDDLRAALALSFGL